MKVRLGAEEKQTADAASKIVEVFRVSKECEEERAEYFVDAYDTGRQSI